MRNTLSTSLFQSVRQSKRAWWNYAYQAILEEDVKRRLHMWSWKRMKKHRLNNDVYSVYTMMYIQCVYNDVYSMYVVLQIRVKLVQADRQFFYFGTVCQYGK